MRGCYCGRRGSLTHSFHNRLHNPLHPMSTTYQDQINALIADTLLHLKEQCKLLAELHDDHEERLERIESNAVSAHLKDNRDKASMTRPKQACAISTTMENTIRLTCHKELADLVVRLCKHDEDTQKLAVSLLLEGEAKMCSFTSRDPLGSAGPSNKRRRR